MQSLLETEQDDLIDLIDIEYIYCTTNGDFNFARLSDSISQSDLRRINSDIKQVRKDVPELPIDADIKFDKLNRLDALRYRIMLVDFYYLIDYYYILYQHFNRYTKKCIDVYKKTYPELYNGIKNKDVLKHLMPNVLSDLVTTHTRHSDKLYKLVTDGLIRKDSLDKMHDAVSRYCSKTEKSSGINIAYTHGTEITNDITKRIFASEYKDDEDEDIPKDTALPKDVVVHDIYMYYTVAVDDDITCDVCSGIAKAQKANPVPFDDMVVGANAPPYHPRCRCRIEYLKDEVVV